ncbi:MAG TPA: amino acid adenylation domain-containing protein, partial [Kofleriaceae bacterium]
DLERGPLIRARLLACRPDHHVLIVTIHHIVCDGWSIGVFLGELAHHYQLRRQRGAAPPPLAVQYGDYAHWQREHHGAAHLAPQLDYWAEQLAGLPPIWLPWDRARPERAEAMLAGAVATTIAADTTAALRKLAGARDTTLANALLAGFQAVLYRYSGQADFAIGVASSNRAAPELEGLIGFFVNLLVIRADLDGAPSFGELVRRVRDTSLAAMAHADVPFEQLVDRVSPSRHMNRHPLFQVSFVFQNLPERAFALPGLTLERVGEDQTARFDLELFLTAVGGELQVNWVYDARLFDRATVAAIADAYTCLLAEAVAAPDAALAQLRLVPPDVAVAQIAAREHARQPFAAAPCLHEVFAATAARFPRRTALVDGAQRWRYAELDAAANRLAHRLIASGVTPGSFVGLYRQRSADLVLSVLAILKAGAAYVPIDAKYPEERVRFILEDSGVACVITDAGTELPAGARARAVLALEPARPDAEPCAAPVVAVTPDHIAYIIYTSGSTGTPKGCPIRHRNVVRLMRATEAWFHFDEKDVWTLFHSVAFDFSVWEIWGAWCYGGKLVVVPHDVSRDPAAFYDLLCSQRVTVLNQTPSAFKAVIAVDRAEQRDAELALRCVVFGGEALDPADLLPWIARHGDAQPRLINMYGITETTVHVTYRQIREVDARAGTSTIGVPIPDLAMHLLDAGGQPVPPGAIGEIYVSGAGVAGAYLGRDELTRQRFVPSPVDPAERWYRTGDLARRLGSGDLEYRGRIDHQVKIRGFRIELDEIRACIQAAPAVRDSLVTLDATTGDPRLIAYVVPDLARLGSREALRRAADHQVAGWQDTFETTYSAANPTGVEDFNTVGWRESLGGDQIPDAEMREWLDDTLGALRALAPRRVLEIGCGTGMLLLDLAPACEAYVGVDFSATTLETLRGVIARRGLGQVELIHRPAHELGVLDGRRFDTIILNSIIQYFPDRDYLLCVLRACAALLAPGGTMFVGDVRNLALLDAYHAELASRRATPETTRAALAARVRTGALQDDELVLDPAMFAGLAGELEGIRAVVLSARPGAAVNELNKYRYDVFLRREPASDALRARLERPASAPVLRALADDAALLDWLAGRGPAVRAGDLDRAKLPAAQAPLHPLQSAPGPRWNQPALAHAMQLQVTELRVHLAKFLPDYMVPAHIVTLAELPVTAHGKIDHAALPRPQGDRPVAAERFVAPEPGVETALAEIWRQVLNVDRVGRDDGFFALGGHSLLATQLIARLNERFGVRLPLRAVFEHPTLASFARLLGEAGPGVAATPAPAPAGIPRRAGAGPAPLAFGQHRLWFLDQLAPGQAAYHTVQAIDVRGPLDLTALQAALSAVVVRHAILRTHIEVIDDEPRQIINERVELVLERRPGTYGDDGAIDDGLRRAITLEVGRPFALDRAPLLRAVVYSQGEARHTLVLIVHHIAIDGWSLGVLVRELDACYAANRHGVPAVLPALPIQYADYAAYQRTWLAGEAAAAQRAYWLDTLAAPPPSCTLPHDPPRGDRDDVTAATITRPLGAALTAALTAYCARHHTTPFTLLAAALYLVLQRVTGSDDIVIGAPIAQRNHRELEPLIGFFVNTLALRARPRADQTFDRFAAQVRDTVVDAFANQDYPFELLVEELVEDRDGTQNPLFQVMLVVQNQAMAMPAWDGASARMVELAPPAAKLDLTFFAGESEDGLTITAEYRTAAYREATIRGCLDALACVLQSALDRPTALLTQLPLAARPAATDVVVPAELFADLVARSVAHDPDAVAVAFADRTGSRTLSYGELARRSDGFARALVAAGVGRERLVAIMVEPCPEAIVMLLGILKAGCAYLPLDPRHPDERLRAILADADVALVVTDRASVPGPTPVWRLDALDARIAAAGDAVTPLPTVTPGQLAYVIYTSGSTGAPKGALLEHRGLANLIRTELAHYGTRRGDRLLLSANLTFDASISEIGNALAAGATLVILPRDRLVPDDALVAELRELAITWWTIRPSFLAMLHDRALPALRTLIIAGERLEAEVVRPWLAPGRTVFNAYGPTEASVCAACAPLTEAELVDGESPAIGRGMDQIALHVLDRWLNPVPDGLPGELYIGGAGVGRGYLGQPALTADRYLPDPWSRQPGARLYRTGDVAKRGADGQVVCLGRSDFQIKLRGYRIDPSEIEAALRRVPGVDDAVVVLRRDRADGDALVGYVATSAPAAELGELVELAERQLRAQLADYMVPRFLVALARLPLSSNGKLDRGALPAPDAAQRSLSSTPRGEAPRTPLEWQLCLCFERVLGRRGIGIDQSFFALGGHSFLALRLVSELGRELGARIPVARIFSHPTVRSLAATLDGADALPAHAGAVTLRAGGALPPVFLIHQAGGYVYSYFALARQLAGDRPIYGLQPPGLDGGEPALASIPALARHHLAAIRALQPHGPYHLAGHSLGGAIAYELARQLISTGEQVAYLGLIDSELSPDDGPAPPDESTGAFGFLIEQIEALFGQPLGVELAPGGGVASWIAATAQALTRAGIADEATATMHVEGLYRVFVASVAALRAYRPEPCPVAARVYRTATLAERLALRPDLAWERWATGGVVQHDIPGAHLDLLQAPHVAVLAAVMTDELAALLEEPRHD